MKSDKIQDIINLDLASLISKIDGCANNLQKSSTTKLGEHTPSEYSMLTIWAFDNIQNKHTIYFKEDCMIKFCSFLREHARNVIKFEKNKMSLLRQKKLQLHDTKECYICGKGSSKKIAKDKNYYKLETIAALQVNIEVQYIVYVS